MRYMGILYEVILYVGSDVNPKTPVFSRFRYIQGATSRNEIRPTDAPARTIFLHPMAVSNAGAMNTGKASAPMGRIYNANAEMTPPRIIVSQNFLGRNSVISQKKRIYKNTN